MNNQLILILKQKLTDLSSYGTIDAEMQRNVLKEELQYHVLNFICHHQEYGKWIMYGGSALRICHGLDRMSVDLDFEVNRECTDDFLEELKKDISGYFANAYGLDGDSLVIKITSGRGLTLRFNIGDDLGMEHPSKQVHVKIDLNRFIAAKAVTERIPINHDQLSFVITTYNMSALMASKIAAIFMRGERGVGETVYAEKGRDIYDLLWYMEKRVIPDLDYLVAKKVNVTGFRDLFDRLTLRMNKVSNKNLEQDLLPLFLDRSRIQNWLDQWLQSYFRLVESYDINTVKDLVEIRIFQDFHTDNFSFSYYYDTDEKKKVRVTYTVSNYWIEYDNGDLPKPIDKIIVPVIPHLESNGISSRQASQERLKQYTALFYQKTEDYLKKVDHTMLGHAINTKIIRMTADNLNQKEQIVLNKSALLSCELEDLFK